MCYTYPFAISGAYLPWCRSRFPSDIICLLSEIFLTVQICWGRSISASRCRKKSLFHFLFLRDIFSDRGILDQQFFSYSSLKIVLFDFWLALFPMINVLLFLTSFLDICLFFSGLLSDFLFITVFKQVDYNGLWSFSCLRFIELLESEGWQCSSNVHNFWSLFPQIYFLYHPPQFVLGGLQVHTYLVILKLSKVH